MASDDQDQRDGGRGFRPGVGVAVAAVTLITIAVVAVVVLAGTELDEEGGGVQLTAQEQRGRQLFNVNCAGCHALQVSNAVGRVGPNLDQLDPPRALILDAIEEGRGRGQGNMPADLVNGEAAEAVAAYITAVAGEGEQ